MYIRGFLHVYNRLSIYICSIFKIPFPHVLCCTSLLSHVCLIVTLWAVACHTPLSIGFPTRNTGVSCHFLLQGFFPTQGSNPYLIASPALEADFLPLSHRGSHGGGSRGLGYTLRKYGGARGTSKLKYTR